MPIACNMHRSEYSSSLTLHSTIFSPYVSCPSVISRFNQQEGGRGVVRRGGREPSPGQISSSTSPPTSPPLFFVGVCSAPPKRLRPNLSLRPGFSIIFHVRKVKGLKTLKIFIEPLLLLACFLNFYQPLNIFIMYIILICISYLCFKF